MQAQRLVAQLGPAAHVRVLDAHDVVVEVVERTLAEGRFDVVLVLARERLAHFRVAHLVGNRGAARFEDGLHRFAHRGIRAARLPGEEEILSVGESRARHGAGPFHVLFHLRAVVSRRVLVPRNLHLPAFVAQVARHGGGEDKFVHTRHAVFPFQGRAFVAVSAAQVGRRARCAVAEDDELDAVEAQQFRPQFVAGIGIARVIGGVARVTVSVTVHLADLRRVVQCHGQSLEVQRPRVDVRVDAEVGGCAEEEGLARFIVGPRFDEDVARLRHVGIGERLRSVLQLQLDGVERVEELRRGVGQLGVSGVERSVDILLGDGLQLRFLHLVGAYGRGVVVAARSKGRQREQGAAQGCGKLGFFHNCWDG